MRKIMERCMAALLAAALVCSLGFSVLAEGGSIQPTSTAVPVGSSDAADVSSSVPPTEPESTPLPESTPASSAAPSETPLPSETPGTGETPAPTETPQATATPMPTPTPAETPSPSAMPEPSGTPAPTATPAPAFEKLEVTDTTGAVQAEVGDEVEFSVELNRDDVEVAYQWQVLDTAPGQEEQPEAIYDYGEGESTDYFFPLEDMTEEELLAQNPGATWPGIEMYYALRDSQVSTFSTRSASAEPPRIENGTPNFVLNPEETDVEAGEIAWRDIDGETKASYVHTVTENEEHLSYRCIVTVTDEEYLAEAQQAAQSAAEGAEPQESEAGEEVPTEAESAENGPSSVPESAPESTVPEKEETSAPDESEQPVSESTAEGLAEESIITETMHIEVPAQPEEDQPEEETQGLIMTGSKSISKGVTTTNTSLAGRPLLTPSQLVRLPWGQFIVQKTGYAPYIAHMRPYKDYLKLEAEQQVPPPSLRYSSVLSASAAMIEAVAKGHLYHLRKGMFDSEDSDW